MYVLDLEEGGENWRCSGVALYDGGHHLGTLYALADGRLNLAQFDPKPVDLDLAVLTSKDLEEEPSTAPVTFVSGPQTPKITSAVHILAL